MEKARGYLGEWYENKWHSDKLNNCSSKTDRKQRDTTAVLLVLTTWPGTKRKNGSTLDTFLSWRRGAIYIAGHKKNKRFWQKYSMPFQTVACNFVRSSGAYCSAELNGTDKPKQARDTATSSLIVCGISRHVVFAPRQTCARVIRLLAKFMLDFARNLQLMHAPVATVASRNGMTQCIIVCWYPFAGVEIEFELEGNSQRCVATRPSWLA